MTACHSSRGGSQHTGHTEGQGIHKERENQKNHTGSQKQQRQCTGDKENILQEIACQEQGPSVECTENFPGIVRNAVTRHRFLLPVTFIHIGGFHTPSYYIFPVPCHRNLSVQCHQGQHKQCRQKKRNHSGDKTLSLRESIPE